MSRKRALEPAASESEQPLRRPHIAHRHLDPGAYTVTQVCERIAMGRSTFYRLKDAGELPFLEEVQPRLGKRPRYRADLVEQYVSGTFNRSHAPQSAVSRPLNGSR